MTKVYAFLTTLLVTASIIAQSTFENVHAILQSNCTIGCHSGATPAASLDLSASVQDVYNSLVSATPVNPAANGEGL